MPCNGFIVPLLSMKQGNRMAYPNAEHDDGINLLQITTGIHIFPTIEVSAFHVAFRFKFFFF